MQHTFGGSDSRVRFLLDIWEFVLVLTYDELLISVPGSIEIWEFAHTSHPSLSLLEFVFPLDHVVATVFLIQPFQEFLSNS